MAAAVDIKGLKELHAKMEQVITDFHGRPMLEAMRDSTLIVTRAATQLAPVDTGRLRASITPDVQVQGDIVLGIVGSNVTYAPYIEYGTRPHFPPVGALEVWASRHGMEAYVVARAISRRGTKAQAFLMPAFEKSQSYIERRIGQAVEGIISK